MAVKNLQNLALCVANFRGVRVTGTECKGTMPADGIISAHLLSLLWQPLPGLYPIRTGPDAKFAEDNAATAQAVERAGRSASGAGVPVSTRLTSLVKLARNVSRTVLSKRSSSSMCIPSHRFAEGHQPEQTPMTGSTRRQARSGELAIHATNLVRG